MGCSLTRPPAFHVKTESVSGQAEDEFLLKHGMHNSEASSTLVVVTKQVQIYPSSIVQSLLPSSP